MADEVRLWLERQLPYTGPITSPEWQAFLANHPKWGTRLADISRARVRRSRLNQSVQLQIALHSNPKRFYTISWHACVPGQTYSSEPDLPGAMRECIYYQIRNWRRRWQGQPTCAYCQATRNIQVDHVSPAFKELTERFLAQPDVVVPDQATWGYSGRTHAPRLPRGLFKTAWCKFHQEHAAYQFLCRSCNCKKGARGEKCGSGN